MQVYDISVRFMRRIQVREYEPAEAEVTVKAQLADNESPDKAIPEAFKIASEQVHIALGLSPDNKLQSGKPSGRRGGAGAAEASATVTAKPAEAAKPAAPAAAQSDIPDTAGAPATPAKPAATQANSDIPDNTPAPQENNKNLQAGGAGESITSAELSKWIGEQVRLGKVTSQQIMSLYPKFGVSRFADLKPEKCGEAKAAIEELIKGTGTVL